MLQLCFDDIWHIPFIDLKTLVFEQLPNWTFIYIIKIKQIFDHKIKDGGTNFWDVKSDFKMIRLLTINAAITFKQKLGEVRLL